MRLRRCCIGSCVLTSQAAEEDRRLILIYRLDRLRYRWANVHVLQQRLRRMLSSHRILLVYTDDMRWRRRCKIVHRRQLQHTLLVCPPQKGRRIHKSKNGTANSTDLQRRRRSQPMLYVDLLNHRRWRPTRPPKHPLQLRRHSRYGYITGLRSAMVQNTLSTVDIYVCAHKYRR